MPLYHLRLKKGLINKMITSRDRDIYNFINEYGSITIDQCSKIFFSHCKRKYEIASRRLRELLKNEYIKVGTIKYTNENIYYIDKKLSFHDLTVIQYCAELINMGAVNLKLERNKKWFDDLISDGFVYYELNGEKYINIIEVCFSNKNVKIDYYDEIYLSNIIQNEFGIDPKLIIITHPNYQYKSIKIPLILFDYGFENLFKIIL